MEWCREFLGKESSLQISKKTFTPRTTPRILYLRCLRLGKTTFKSSPHLTIDEERIHQVRSNIDMPSNISCHN